MHRAPSAARLAARRAELAELDICLTTACERAVGQGRRNPIASSAATSWSTATRGRYLREARTQDYLLGPRMRRLAAEIGRVETGTHPDLLRMRRRASE